MKNQIIVLAKVSQTTLGRDGKTTEGSMGRRWVCKQ